MPTAVETADDRVEILDGLGKFIDSVVVPLEAKHQRLLDDPHLMYGSDGGYSKELQAILAEVRTSSARAGYYTLFAPRDIGGGGYGALMQYETWEYLYHRYGPGRIMPYDAVAHWTSGPSLLCAYLSEAMKASVLQAFMSGEATFCFAMSEPDAGSDAWAMRTAARRNGDGWVMSGTKQWISNSPHARYAFVFAVTDDTLKREHAGGISCFLVPTDSAGFRIDSVIKLFGHSGGNEAIISFDDVHLPEDCLVGELHRGFDLALAGVSLGRMYNAGRCVGLARWALERATEYSQQRKTFGRPIADYQAVSFMLADSAIDIYGAKTMAIDCANRLERGMRATRELAMVKAFSTEMCFRVYDRCIQVHGAMGLTNEMRLYDGWHQARIVRIADGSGEIMRRDVARALLKGDIDF